MSDTRTWGYHPTEEPKIFPDAAALKAAGPKWRDRPYTAAAEPDKPAEKPAKE